MLDTVVRLLAAFADRSDQNVNKIVQGLPRARIDGPDDPMPKPVHVFVDLDIGGIDPPKTPALVFWMDSSADIELKGLHRVAKEVMVAVGYITDDAEKEERALSDCGLILRATEIGLKRFNSQGMSLGFRELNGIKIHSVEKVSEQRVTTAKGKRKLWGVLFVPVVAVDSIT